MESVITMGKKNNNRESNRLIHEKSPYLLQHAYNPVDWYPWGPEAFEKAVKENKPIFLSIGYSTCHWCHVMEKESFEDPEVAKLLNKVFVCIKVDREERPDIDNIYMAVCQMVTGGGGWPLTIMMTPDKKPFFAGTYIPKEGRYGRMGLKELIFRIHDMWTTKSYELLDSAKKFTNALQQISTIVPGKKLEESLLEAVHKQLALRFDKLKGGFSSAPKFPSPHNLLFLLRSWKRHGDEETLLMVEKTLQEMHLGGIYDHIGFGFHRYSTDSHWLVPHFEKMLYDQAMLAMAYIETYQATGKSEYKQTTQEIFTYVLRDMTDPKGGFYSAEDADSEGVEGKFYVWTEDEIRQVLNKEDADLIIKVFNIEKEGNFREEATQKKTGENIFHLKKPLSELATEMKMTEQDLQKSLDRIRQKLFAIREKRIHPHKDDKVLVDWNGLFIAALAKGAQIFDEPKYAEAAEEAVDFILNEMRTSQGRLLHRYRDGQAAIPAHVDDYSFLIWGLIELYEATFKVRYLQAALDLNKDFLEHFWDEKAGGFFFTADDSEELLVRSKESYDGAIPSGNSVAMLNLLRLARIATDTDLETKAAEIGSAFSEKVNQLPSAHTFLACALDFAIGPTYEIVIVGESLAEDTKIMLETIRSTYLPNKIVILRPLEEQSPIIIQLAEFTKEHKSIEGKATVYVCINYNCRLPTTDANWVKEMLTTKN